MQQTVRCYVIPLTFSEIPSFQASIISICLALLSLFCVSPMFFAHELKRFPYLKNRFFCDVRALDANIVMNYVVFSSIFHFFLTCAVVTCLYAAIYYRLRSR